MRLSTRDELRELIEAAESAVEAAADALSSAQARHHELMYAERELAAEIRRCEARVAEAEELRTELRKRNPEALFAGAQSIFKKPLPDLTSERPAVIAPGVQEPGGSPDARPTE